MVSNSPSASRLITKVWVAHQERESFFIYCGNQISANCVGSISFRRTLAISKKVSELLALFDRGLRLTE
jgi:hypothetical protein